MSHSRQAVVWLACQPKQLIFINNMMLDVCCSRIRVRVHLRCDVASTERGCSRKAHLVATKRLNNGTRPNGPELESLEVLQIVAG